jgi:hypothetical protein
VHSVSPAGLISIDPWPADDESTDPPRPLSGSDEAPGIPGMRTQPPFASVGRDGAVGDGALSDGGAASVGAVNDEGCTVTDPPPDALVPADDPDPVTEPPDGDAVAFVDTCPPPGSVADDGGEGKGAAEGSPGSSAVFVLASALRVGAGAAPLSKAPASTALPAAAARAATAARRPKGRLACGRAASCIARRS